jgi:putative membrane protein
MSELNDPRVFFAAERTLLAWNRTSLTLMAFGFVIERFGLLLHLLSPQREAALNRSFSFWIGIAFILLGAFCAAAAIAQYRTVLRTLKPAEIPEGYRTHMGIIATLAVAVLGLAISVYLFAHGPGL